MGHPVIVLEIRLPHSRGFRFFQYSLACLSMELCNGLSEAWNLRVLGTGRLTRFQSSGFCLFFLVIPSSPYVWCSCGFSAMSPEFGEWGTMEEGGRNLIDAEPELARTDWAILPRNRCRWAWTHHSQGNERVSGGAATLVHWNPYKTG